MKIKEITSVFVAHVIFEALKPFHFIFEKR